MVIKCIRLLIKQSVFTPSLLNRDEYEYVYLDVPDSKIERCKRVCFPHCPGLIDDKCMFSASLTETMILSQIDLWHKYIITKKQYVAPNIEVQSMEEI